MSHEPQVHVEVDVEKMMLELHDPHRHGDEYRFHFVVHVEDKASVIFCISVEQAALWGSKFMSAWIDYAEEIDRLIEQSRQRGEPIPVVKGEHLHVVRESQEDTNE